MNRARLILTAAVASLALIAPAAASAQSPAPTGQTTADIVVSAQRDLDKIQADIKAVQARMAKRNTDIKAVQAQIADLQYRAANAPVSVRPKILAPVAGLKAQLDTLNAAQQVDTLELQRLTRKYSETSDALSNLLKKLADSKNTIIGNIR